MSENGLQELKVYPAGEFYVIHVPNGRGEELRLHLESHGVRSLVSDTAARYSDGVLYGVVANAMAMGRGLMPRYGDKVRGVERWDLVNYVRTLQALARGGGR